MAAIHGVRRSNGFEPPPSSILATRIASKDAATELNQASFDQLLEESLATDENGQPNLGSDVSINLKVVEVVLKAGIDPVLRDSIDDPFQPNSANARAETRFLACLEVIRVATERAEGVLFMRTSANGKSDDLAEPPLYIVMVPKLLSALGPQASVPRVDAILETISTCIHVGGSSKQGTPNDAVTEFLLGSVFALATTLSQKVTATSSGTFELNDEAFVDRLWKIRPACHGLASRFRFNSRAHVFFSIAKILQTLSKYSLPPPRSLQLRKTIQQVLNTFEDLVEDAADNQDLSELIENVSQLEVREHPDTAYLDDTTDDLSWPDGERARKRPRLSDVQDGEIQQPSIRQQLCRRLTGKLTGNAVGDLVGLHTTAAAAMKRFGEDQQTESIDSMGSIICQMAQDSLTQDRCTACNGDSLIRSTSDVAAEELMRTLLAVIPPIKRNPAARVSSMTALRRILLHTQSLSDSSLRSSTAGEWCLQCLRSSSRDLRIAAIATLQVYVMDIQADISIARDNRVVALEFLQSLWSMGDTALQETTILALTRIAQVVGEEEQNIIILRLVEYLGHNNSYISGLVYEEIQQLAAARQVTTAVLFRPFWRTVGLVIAKNMASRPAIAEQICSLVGMQTNGLMLLIEEYALPNLVLNQELNIITQFAAAHGSSTTAFDICTAPRNLAAILAHLLMQGYQDAEQKIMEMLMAVSDDFASLDLSGWLNHDPIQITCTLLKSAGEASESKSSRTYHALQFLASILLRKPGQHMSSSKRGETLSTFLESHCLAIVTHFTVLLNDIEAKEPKLEKKRSVTALSEIVKLGKARVVKALPQICACLRSSLDDSDLCDTAFASWATVIRSLKEDDIQPLVNQTIAIIVKYWDRFSSVTQNMAYDLIADLLKQHTIMIRDNFETMPSFGDIPVLSKFQAEIGALKRQLDERRTVTAFIERLEDENEIVIEQALRELSPVLRAKQGFLQQSILREKPDAYISGLTRALLASPVKFRSNQEINRLSAHCLASIGCLDSNKIEASVERKPLVIPSNFSSAGETVDFIMYFLEHVLVKTFLSASTTRAQGFLAWAMQELLNLCHEEDTSAPRIRSGPSSAYRRWNDLPEAVRNTLAPFQTSKYRVQDLRTPEGREYPYFKPGMAHEDWLRAIVMDFLHRSPGSNVQLIYSICSRVIQGQDLSIPSFLLPYTVLSLLVSGVDKDVRDIVEEILNVLGQSLAGHDRRTQEDIKSCSQSIFEVLQYLSRYLQSRRKNFSVHASKNDRTALEVAMQVAQEQIKAVEHLIDQIPPDLISQRAIECKSYSRALFHWEQHIRKSGSVQTRDSDLARLQDIYAQIDEPDGIEGISAQMNFVDVEGRVLEHKKAGRWTTAQGWYQMQIVDRPDDIDLQKNLMQCLRESGQHHLLLDRYETMVSTSQLPLTQLKPYAIESAWATYRWDELAKLVSADPSDDFTTCLGKVLLQAYKDDHHAGSELIEELYRTSALELSPNAIMSLANSYESLRKMHTIDDLRLILETTTDSKTENMKILRKRLDILGSNVQDKQYLLSVRRAAMQIRKPVFSDNDIAGAWLTSARLARKAKASSQAFDAVLAAAALGDKSSSIEEAKLIWQDGHHRKAIQTLEGAISSGAFIAHTYVAEDGPVTLTTEQQNNQNELTAKAYLLLGKWLDRAGQTQSEEIKNTFRKSTEHFRKWEKGWYYLGRHYNKLLDSEKLMPPGKESQTFLTGELAKLVIENYLRSLINGGKFVFQTLPKVLTLWFELVAGSDIPTDPRRGNEKFHQHNNAQRKRVIDETHKYIQKYVDRIQAAVLYTILPQVVARICHTNPAVYNILVSIVVKVVRAFPNQALWTLLAVAKSQSKDRASRGLTIISKVVEGQKKSSGSGLTPSELRNMISAGQRFSDEILRVSEYPIEGKISRVSLARDLGFHHKIAPSRLVVPVESCLVPSIPTSYDSAYLKSFRAFDKDPVTISAFLDDALVLSSLQKPRKLSIRGSDGAIYGVLAKPKDDLRKDQRLMEFNTMINRFLKRDVDASKRRLYIRTYAVVPLNEECGLIEWVNNLKTFRDIILKLYKDKSISPNYTEIRNLLDESCSGPPEKCAIFSDRILKTFPPVFHEWFIDSFPDPSAWFAARLRYTRSCAVMSIVGHVLGLGDRHGENILFEEDNGSLMHVDFNCLFDKGLTFEKPEHVPFRLTHNMVDAMGPPGYEGPWRRCSEITLTLLRNNEDALMTILETFLHDPTTDFLERERRRKKAVAGVPNSPVEVLESVRGKVRGFLQGESVPLSVGGYVQEMVHQATDEWRLCRMYIGWCAFF
ncbi:uncharacterized protein HMPREF1541_01178 [Cyphellophora europaea CBS 101466]|uniref:Serine/threonine-protein kinase MEC1 n=1 Tax=Cyphellophora europaea (strain CBS 101466) TaxID=1220924 RepID=W2SG64_CYPE1|nr:uncharacterized protein HMPREF1541_01178 [Cyphellophora europaea CBS 101466]ETN46988.1 hypothetical protein HMPREF1541_01178 [Cyphellophora europaea CBS 101466]